jgi:hypothetical protein
MVSKVKKIFAVLIFFHFSSTALGQDSLRLQNSDTLINPTPAYYYQRPEKIKEKHKLQLVPGINLFVLTARGTAVDFNPYVFKQVSKKWSLGIGWNQRVSLNRYRSRGNYTSQLFGPRLFITYHWAHGFSVRVIPEVMHIRLPRNLYPDLRYRWDWSLFAGVRKDFKISKNTTGYVELLYDVASTSIQPLYGDKVNLRFGFEFRNLRKKKPQD